MSVNNAIANLNIKLQGDETGTEYPLAVYDTHVLIKTESDAAQEEVTLDEKLFGTGSSNATFPEVSVEQAFINEQERRRSKDAELEQSINNANTNIQALEKNVGAIQKSIGQQDDVGDTTIYGKLADLNTKVEPLTATVKKDADANSISVGLTHNGLGQHNIVMLENGVPAFQYGEGYGAALAAANSSGKGAYAYASQGGTLDLYGTANTHLTGQSVDINSLNGGNVEVTNDVSLYGDEVSLHGDEVLLQGAASINLVSSTKNPNNIQNASLLACGNGAALVGAINASNKATGYVKIGNDSNIIITGANTEIQGSLSASGKILYSGTESSRDWSSVEDSQVPCKSQINRQLEYLTARIPSGALRNHYIIAQNPQNGFLPLFTEANSSALISFQQENKWEYEFITGLLMDLYENMKEGYLASSLPLITLYDRSASFQITNYRCFNPSAHKGEKGYSYADEYKVNDYCFNQYRLDGDKMKDDGIDYAFCSEDILLSYTHMLCYNTIVHSGGLWNSREKMLIVRFLGQDVIAGNENHLPHPSACPLGQRCVRFDSVVGSSIGASFKNS